MKRSILGCVTSFFSKIMLSRDRLPRLVNWILDNVASNPDGLLATAASTLLGGHSAAQRPAATDVPNLPVRVLIGPTNYSGQGRLWAASLASRSDRIGARNLAVDLPGGFSFDADTRVPVSVYNVSSRWQRQEFTAAAKFTHVLIEAERPLFGSLFARDCAREVAELTALGLSCAFICHGTDIRSPREHILHNRWSPFLDDPKQTAFLQRTTDENLALIRSMGVPVFVSTPDLLEFVEEGIWCPVVVDSGRWFAPIEPLIRRRPIVAHAPSMGYVKGTHLIEKSLIALDARGVIEYRPVSGVPASRMPSIIGAADIVLDQFRIGSYGVAACEAMAAGRLVIGHVTPRVRDAVSTMTGFSLPIVEATPASVAETIERIVAEPELAREIASTGPEFVGAVHSGVKSADVLIDRWIEKDSVPPIPA